MTKKYFLELSEYNIWANEIVIGWFEKITDSQWLQNMVSSFNSIEQTALHVAGAEQVWLERFMNKENVVWLPSVFKGTKKDIIDLWRNASQGLKDFILQFDEDKLKTDLQFKRINGEIYLMPYYELLAHVFNHSTYHRGQIVTMLRQARFTEVASTDLLGYYRQISHKQKL